MNSSLTVSDLQWDVGAREGPAKTQASGTNDWVVKTDPLRIPNAIDLWINF